MLKIERAEKKDMPKVAKLINSSYDMYEEFVDPKDLDQHHIDKAWIEKNYEKRNFYIARAGEESVGTITMQYFGKVAYLGYIYLDVEHMGKGYGKKLIDHARKICEEKGVTSMVLIAHPEATWAIRAYEKYGFKLVSTKKEEILNFNGGFMKPYYEEGFHLYRYNVNVKSKMNVADETAVAAS